MLEYRCFSVMPASQDTFDPTIQSEDISFRREELVTCECGRQNPPNRVDCLYCGRALDVKPEAVDKFVIRKLEPWEPGTNILITSAGADIARAAELLSLDREQVEGILSADVALPAARVDAKAASTVAAKLEEFGFGTRAISDADLTPTKMPVRISAMQITDGALIVIDFNSGAQYRHSWDELMLLVQGFFSTGKIDSMEKRRLRKTTVMAETMTSADEPVFDLYVRDNKIGYRVQLAGFDYSCLGDQMAPLATENMMGLIQLIHSRSPEAQLVDGYKKIRHLLTGIWDIESRKDPKGLQQVGFGKREFGVVHSTSNIEQFTRFSRLQRLML